MLRNNEAKTVSSVIVAPVLGYRIGIGLAAFSPGRDCSFVIPLFKMQHMIDYLLG
jgi:hypothetical protein